MVQPRTNHDRKIPMSRANGDRIASDQRGTLRAGRSEHPSVRFQAWRERRCAGSHGPVTPAASLARLPC